MYIKEYIIFFFFLGNNPHAVFKFLRKNSFLYDAKTKKSK